MTASNRVPIVLKEAFVKNWYRAGSFIFANGWKKKAMETREKSRVEIPKTIDTTFFAESSLLERYT